MVAAPLVAVLMGAALIPSTALLLAMPMCAVPLLAAPLTPRLIALFAVLPISLIVEWQTWLPSLIVAFQLLAPPTTDASPILLTTATLPPEIQLYAALISKRLRRDWNGWCVDGRNSLAVNKSLNEAP